MSTKRWGTAVFALIVTLSRPLWAADRPPYAKALGDKVTTDKGVVEGKASGDKKIRIFEGIPYAAPPVGDLRWKAPQPAKDWKGVKNTTTFGPRSMQGRIFDDMVFRDKGPSEDCLYLNVWTPAASADAKLPVMVWIYGGGFVAGAASEPRQDGENLARKDVVVVSFNYRLGVFGFFAHPELSAESGTNSSGNYGLLDQVEALRWVQKNISAFGGDPDNVTIFGESAGSFSVSALMASPLTKGLFQRAIGESGALLGASRSTKSRSETEKEGAKFAESVGAKTLKDLRTRSAEELLKASLKGDTYRFKTVVDGLFLTEDPGTIYKKGKQASVPLLAGWNADEGGVWIMNGQPPTWENFGKLAREKFGKNAGTFLKLYSGKTEQEVKRAVMDYSGDDFIAFATWKWIEAQAALGKVPVYRYQFDVAMPAKNGEASMGAHHSSEIEFVFGALKSRHLPWRPEDRKTSEIMMGYWSNFARTGDPNGPGLPEWPL